MSTQLSDLESEKMNQSILDHIILGVAHEINNPNTFVRMNVMNIKKMLNLLRPALDQYAQEHPDEKLGRFTVDEIRSKLFKLLESTLGATVRIITVADKLKQCTSFALSQSDQVSTVEVIQSVIDMHKFLIDKWAKLEFNYDPESQYMIEGHKLQLEQALSIFVTNSCDAISEKFPESDSGEILGRLSVSLEENNDHVVIRFKDNGPGIKDEHLQKIFSPYFTTKPQGVGDGMGLPLSQAIIERHGGKINVETEVGTGTEFIVTLAKKS